jgi:GrpB-like predicted nucleotidyltransferase (UPF0157 family)
MRLVAYDPAWVLAFEEERAALERVLAPWLEEGVHHIGSTAVPGLAAKPIIDMLAGVDDLDRARAAFEPLRALGYEHLPHRPEAHAFVKGDTHHLHLTPPGSDLWRERLAFRDALRADQALRDEYAAWKAEHAGVDGYLARKRPLVMRVLAQSGIDLKPDEARLSLQAFAARRP